jgi:hypothetical protein
MVQITRSSHIVISFPLRKTAILWRGWLASQPEGTSQELEFACSLTVPGFEPEMSALFRRGICRAEGDGPTAL